MADSKRQGVIEVFNPANGEKLGEVRSCSAEEARAAITRARAAQKHWEAIGLDERIRVIRRFRDILLDRAQEMSEAISRENGKVLQESLEMEVFPIVDLATYFCDRVQDILAPRRISLHLLKHRRSYIHYRPRGLLLVIAPWNFPFSIPFGEVVMGLLAGNAVVLKPASLTPLIALKGRELFDEAGLDQDLFQVLPCPGRVGAEMIEMGVDYVNFTGSTAVGVKVAETCGRRLIPSSMELGGKTPAIVLPDADLDVVAGSLVWGAFANAGQVCASIERAYVHESLYDEVVARVVDKVRTLKVGDPLEDGTDMGPMTDPGQLDIVINQVKDAIAHGARALTGGQRLAGPGQFYPPTVLVDVTDETECVREETFGPTLPIMKYHSVEEAIERANNSPYGLTASVYGRDPEQMRKVAERLEAGTVMTNEALVTHACPETPWQGCKASGTGRVHSDEGLRDLCFGYHVNEEVVPTMSWSPFWQPYSHHMFQAILGAARALDHSDLATKASGLLGLVDGAYRMIRQAVATGRPPAP
ncbi:MAG TPA: aldehyde dehydrogenase family protein [Polyangia bacterium]|jgi:succinate-semialdehyde dehydrogenase/glutarate-semialdehyde dehydrogenase